MNQIIISHGRSSYLNNLLGNHSLGVSFLSKKKIVGSCRTNINWPTIDNMALSPPDLTMDKMGPIINIFFVLFLVNTQTDYN